MTELLIRLVYGVVYALCWVYYRVILNALHLIVGGPIVLAEEARNAYIDWNDERIIRSIERDVVTSARRMNKVAAR